MRIVKLLFTYLFWAALSLLLGIGYMRLVLGPNSVSEEGLWYLIHLFFEIGLFHVGLWVGAAIALCFIVVDIAYLNKKLKNNPKKTLIRLVVLLMITVLVAVVHYLLEKVIDVI